MALPESNITKDMFEPAHLDTEKSEEIAGKSIGFWGDVFRRLGKNKGAVVCGIIILFLIFMALVGPAMDKWSAFNTSLLRVNLPPRIGALANIHWLPFDGMENGVNVYKAHGVSGNFWFGTDNLGRDLWSRVWLGTRISLLIGIVAAIVDLLIGVTYGAISSYFGGWTDIIMQRIIEIIIGIPNLVLIILLILILQPGLISIIIAIAITNWVGQARIVRGEILKLKSAEFALAARTLGGGHMRIIFKHLIPNSIGMIIINTMFAVPAAIFFEAFLSFIGLGINPPQASLGSLINEGSQVITIHPYQALYPGIIISLLLICFNVFADGLRDALDPKLKD